MERPSPSLDGDTLYVTPPCLTAVTVKPKIRNLRSGLEWRKGGEIGEKSCPKRYFFEKTHKTHVQQQKHIFFGKKKSRRDTPQLSLGGSGGAGPGPNRNKIGQIWSR